MFQRGLRKMVLVDWGKEMGVLTEFVRARTATLVVGLDACDKCDCGDS